MSANSAAAVKATASGGATGGTVVAIWSEVSPEAIAIGVAVSMVSAFLGQLRNIDEGLPGWRTFLGAIISGGISGAIVVAFGLSNGMSPYYVFIGAVIAGVLGGSGLDLILRRAKRFGEVD